MLRSTAALLLMGAFTMTTANGATDPLSTLAEQTGFKRTGRYEEVERLCKAYAAKYPQAVRCFEFGRSPEGRPMMALAASRAGALTPKDAKAKGLPVLFFQGGIHSGEIDGKDAGFLVLRDLLDNRRLPGALEKVTFVFVPVFSVDAHERFARWNRPNQNGPEEMGWRVTSDNLNLNRDYTKAQAPEMQAMLRALKEWDPILYVDLHATDGAQFEHDISLQVEPKFSGDTGLRPLGAKLLADVNQRLAAKGSLPVDFYPSLRDGNDPASGFAYDTYTPRYSTGYWALHNRFAILVETHSWKDYKTRVRITRDSMLAMIEMAIRDGAVWLKTAAAADERSRKLAGNPLTLTYKGSDKHTMIDFRGYAYTRTPSDISGGTVLRYDPSKPQIWRVPLYTEVLPNLDVVAPKGGYLIPAAQAQWLKAKLDVHGVEYRVLRNAVPKQEFETFRATTATYGARSNEDRQTLTLAGQWNREQREAPAGSLFVPIAQRRSRLVMALLEPRAPDSFAYWGFFNAFFERKEYMEPYVAEDVAREMLKDPAVAAEFKRRLDSDADFAKSSQQRLDFFYRRHPSYDDRFNLYPVMRTDKVL